MTRLEELIAAYRNTMPCVKLNRTIFFDESNNFRKGVIGTEKDNNEDLENLYFTLGGIVTKDPINFPELLDYIGAKQIPRDAKYKFFTLKHNGFTEAIAQPRLSWKSLGSYKLISKEIRSACSLTISIL